jgi:hypothetical protein
MEDRRGVDGVNSILHPLFAILNFRRFRSSGRFGSYRLGGADGGRCCGGTGGAVWFSGVTQSEVRIQSDVVILRAGVGFVECSGGGRDSAEAGFVATGEGERQKEDEADQAGS